MASHQIDRYADAYYSMIWCGPKGYPEQVNAGRCYQTGLLGMVRYNGEPDILFADGSTGDGFSFRWCPAWGAPAFNGGKGPFHELWEYLGQATGFDVRWEEDHESGFDEAWSRLRALVDRDIPVQVGLHFSVISEWAEANSPAVAIRAQRPAAKYGFGHHVVVAGYDDEGGTVTIWEPNDDAPHARFTCPVDAFRRAWAAAEQRSDGHYAAWPHHHPWNDGPSLHDGYGPWCMVWIEPGRDPRWDIARSIRHSYRRNLKILRGEYPKPYALFGNQWMIPHWETGAPGMARCAQAVLDGTLGDVQLPGGATRALFAEAQIPNHGVMGRASAAGYLRRVAAELDLRGLPFASVAAAALGMDQSSGLFRELRYERDLKVAGTLLARIAEVELGVLAEMEAGWAQVSMITERAPATRAA
ncbi:MAG: hypothetical protein ACK515_05975 [bacterium]|jgi:hypothetical protein|nr:BtrH N-terminal domain-containing protein [Betaproteobacteria bacterium]